MEDPKVKLSQDGSAVLVKDQEQGTVNIWSESIILYSMCET